MKEDAPHNVELQNYRLPSVIGGEVDCLLDIKYNCLFPEVLHQLPCGLAIYKSLLMSHDGLSNATIAGLGVTKPSSSLLSLLVEWLPS